MPPYRAAYRDTSKKGCKAAPPITVRGAARPDDDAAAAARGLKGSRWPPGPQTSLGEVARRHQAPSSGPAGDRAAAAGGKAAPGRQPRAPCPATKEPAPNLRRTWAAETAPSGAFPAFLPQTPLCCPPHPTPR